MTDKEIIEKATKALKALDLYGEYESIKVIKIDDDAFFEMLDDDSMKEEYSVSFSYKLPDGRGAGTSVKVDRKTHKLLMIITKSGMYKVPKELQ